MRMRKKKNLDVRFERCASVMVSDPRAVRGKWREKFGNDNPIRLEIGCGKVDSFWRLPPQPRH